MRIKLDKHAIMPKRAHKTDAGLDLYAPHDAVIDSVDMVKQFAKALDMDINIVNTSKVSTFEQLKTSIAMLSDYKFAEEITDIVSCEHNTYDFSRQIKRMLSIVELLKL